MRIHTKLNFIQVRESRPEGVYLTKLTEHGSRVADHAFEVQLSGSSTRRQNTRDWDAPNAATWDEWGTFLAALYKLDPEALCGSKSHPIYANADDFHFQTGDRFDGESVPEDTHPQHRWEYVGELCTGVVKHRCSKCSAVQQRHN